MVGLMVQESGDSVELFRGKTIDKEKLHDRNGEKCEASQSNIPQASSDSKRQSYAGVYSPGEV